MVHPGRSWTAAGPVRARAPTSAFSSADFPQFYPSDINKLRVFVNLIERERKLYQEQDMQWGGSALRDARVRVREHKLLTEWPNRAISGKPSRLFERKSESCSLTLPSSTAGRMFLLAAVFCICWTRFWECQPFLRPKRSRLMSANTPLSTIASSIRSLCSARSMRIVSSTESLRSLRRRVAVMRESRSSPAEEPVAYDLFHTQPPSGVVRWHERSAVWTGGLTRPSISRAFFLLNPINVRYTQYGIHCITFIRLERMCVPMLAALPSGYCVCACCGSPPSPETANASANASFAPFPKATSLATAEHVLRAWA